MSVNFGRIAPSASVKDTNAVQSFKMAEDYLSTLNNSIAVSNDAVADFKQSVKDKFSTALDGVTSTSSAADIGAALKELNETMQGL